MKRGDSNDPRVKAALEDPGVQAILTEKATATAIGSAIQATSACKLTAWVAVATWEDEQGNTFQTVMGDGHSNRFETRGLLHDGVWLTAHQD